MDAAPKTLLEAVAHFADYENCHNFMVSLRWPAGVRCPTCGTDRVSWLANQRRWKCPEKHSQRQFSLKTGTIFEDSPLPLSKWLPAVWLIVNCKNGVSSYEIHRAIGVTQKTAWFMGHRIRAALHAGSFTKLTGEVEVDETFIGGKARNMHLAQRKRRISGRGPTDKTAVLGMLERGGKVATMVVPNRTKKTLQPAVKKYVAAGSALFSDELKSYGGLDAILRAQGHQPRRPVRRRERAHERHGKLLVAAQAGTRRHLRERRAVPLVPLPRRAGVPLQRAAREGHRPVQARDVPGRWEASDLREVERPASRPGAGVDAASTTRPAVDARISAAPAGDTDKIAFIAFVKFSPARGPSQLFLEVADSMISWYPFQDVSQQPRWYRTAGARDRATGAEARADPRATGRPGERAKCPQLAFRWF